MPKRIVQGYNEQFGSEVKSLSPKEIRKFVKELGLVETFPYDKMNRKSIANQPQEIISFLGNVVNVTLEANEVVGDLVNRAFSANIRDAKLPYSSITLQDVFSALVVMGREDQAHLVLESWSKTEMGLKKQEDATISLVASSLEAQNDAPPYDMNIMNDVASKLESGKSGKEALKEAINENKRE